MGMIEVADMTDTAFRIPQGVRSISNHAMSELLAALGGVKHTKLVEALIAILGPEADRRTDPMNEPVWPAIDMTAWSVDELFRGVRVCLSVTSVLNEREARALMHSIGCLCWSDFRHRIGPELLPFSETP